MADQPEYSAHHRADVEVSQDGDAVKLTAPTGGVALTADEAQELASRLFEAAMLANGDDPGENDWARVPMQYVRVAAERMEFDVEAASRSGRTTTRRWATRRTPRSTAGSRTRPSATRCTSPPGGSPNTGGSCSKCSTSSRSRGRTSPTPSTCSTSSRRSPTPKCSCT